MSEKEEIYISILKNGKLIGWGTIMPEETEQEYWIRKLSASDKIWEIMDKKWKKQLEKKNE